MRVVRIITRLNIGGPAIQAITLCDRLTARGFDTLLVHGRLGAAEGDMRYLLPDGVDVRYEPSLQRPLAPLSDLIAVIRIFGALRAARPQIVHTHMAKAGLAGRVAAFLYNRTAGRAAPTRVVHTYHGHVLDGYFTPLTAKVLSFAERQLARVTDAIVAISPQIRTELIDAYSIGRPSQYFIIPLGFDLDALLAIDDASRIQARQTLSIVPGAHVVTTVGRLTAIKQHSLFLETARRIADRDKDAIFAIVGDGDLRGELEAQARDLGIADRTRFLGWRRDLAAIYAATDVFLLTSRNEGTPVALIESLAAATPAVSTDVGGVRDVICDERIGLLAPFGNSEMLAAHVLDLLSEPEKRRRMGACGREFVASRYRIERLVDDVDALYRALLR